MAIGTGTALHIVKTLKNVFCNLINSFGLVANSCTCLKGSRLALKFPISLGNPSYQEQPQDTEIRGKLFWKPSSSLTEQAMLTFRMGGYFHPAL